MTNIFMDWEFWDAGFDNERILFPISVGLKVHGSQRSYYAVNSAVVGMWDKLSEQPFLRDHVLPKLPQRNGGFDKHHRDVWPIQHIRDEIYNFILTVEDPQLWAWYSAYDHLNLARLWGPMVNMPEDIPWFTHDIKTLEWLAEYQTGCNLSKDIPKQNPKTEHHALFDAMHDEELFDYFMGYV